ncbi:MAG TPA: carboxypeptidase regulatory-like domain-containing protein [Longimicrobiales bacterium]
MFGRILTCLALIALLGASTCPDAYDPTEYVTLSGLVTINGEPASGVWVVATRYAPFDSAITGPAGRYQISIRPEDDDAILVGPRDDALVAFLTHPRLLCGRGDRDCLTGDYLPVPPGVVDTLDFEGFSRASIRGHVRWHGIGVPGVTIIISPALGPDIDTTDVTGTYLFAHQPPGTYRIQAGLLPTSPAWGMSLSPVGIEAVGPNAEAELRGKDAVVDWDGEFKTGAIIEGSVRVDGTPLGGVVVSVDGRWAATDTTDAAGGYRMPAVPEGDYTVAIAGYDTAAYSFPTTTFPATVAWLDTVRVDFEGTAVTEANQPPAATIAQPADGASYTEGDTVAFAGGATDPEDGALAGGSLVWRSDVDGPIGTDTAFTRADLSVGAHTITLTATDADGGTGTASITLTVDPPPPSAEPGSISGVVTVNGEPLNDVNVELGGAASAVVSPASDGSYVFPDLAPGTYTVTVAGFPSGVMFPNTTVEVTLEAGEAATVDFAGTFSGDD